MATDSEIILNALQKERDELHDKIMQLDRIIKRVKSFEYAGDTNTDTPKELPVKRPNIALKAPDINSRKPSDIKLLILNIFDSLGKALKLKDIQGEYHRLTGHAYNVRDLVRSLNRSGLVLMVRLKDSYRGVYWIKTDWVQDGALLDEYKPDGFDYLYKPDNLFFE